jgi:uncharacterized Ntn-hydrolase superfamily protein
MRTKLMGAIGLLICTSLCLGAIGPEATRIATFSIVGYDPETEELGIAVASKFLAVGAVVPWAKAGAGAVATQSYANTTYGPEGLKLMASGLDAPNALDNLVNADEDRERRQVGMVDARGVSATFTGKECIAWAGGKAGKYYACQGNILVGEETVNAMAETFETTEGELAVRLIRALKAGEDAGGDSRGKQSAALLVVKEGGGYLGLNDRYIDLRVDDHPRPIDELMRILDIQLSYSALFKASALKQQGDLAAAAAEAQRAVDINPELPEALYDLACYYSLAGMKEEALKALEKAIALSPEFRQMAREDPDLEPLRNEGAFKQILGQ